LWNNAPVQYVIKYIISFLDQFISFIKNIFMRFFIQSTGGDDIYSNGDDN
jgi:hypothetical protein